MAGTSVIWDPVFTTYDFGPHHPMGPARLKLTAALARSLGLFDTATLRTSSIASDGLLETVHSPEYIAAVRAAGLDPGHADRGRGLGTDDDPAFVGMHDISARIVQGSVDVARDVWTGASAHGVNFCGGLHHAMAETASGFCIYNDAAVAIRWLLDNGAARVAYVDVDVHHGDGVERVFWDDPRVLTISVHESGRHLFPGTGFAHDLGGPAALGSAVNLALPPGVGDSAWLRAIDAVVPPLLRAFAPQVIVSQHGADTHFNDPLAHQLVTIDGQLRAQELVHDLAHEVASGRWVALGGGGYDLFDAVPRSWAHLTGIASHRPVDPSTRVPQEWRDEVFATYGVDAPTTMSDLDPEADPIWVRPWSAGHNPDNEVDRAVQATREAVFGLHGLDPWLD